MLNATLFNLYFFKTQETSNENGWVTSMNKSIDEFDCFPNGYCKNWNATFASTLTLTNKPLLNPRPWNCNQTVIETVNSQCNVAFGLDFPEFKTDGRDKFISPAINYAQKAQHNKSIDLSILADEAQILLTGDEIWQGMPGLLINLGPTGNDWIRLCTNVTKDLNASVCYDKVLIRNNAALKCSIDASICSCSIY